MGKENLALETAGLSKRFGKGGAEAVSGLTFSVKAGEIFSLLGPNGSGKTTTVRLLTGQLKPTRGTAKVLGVNPEKNPIGARELVGIMPEQETPPSFLTAKEYLEFCARIRGLENPEGVSEEWLAFFSLEGERDYLCKDLSRGTRQKLMFAQAFMHRPRLAFIDEPLINLDPFFQKKVRDYMKEYAKGGGTIFFCTHVLEVAEKICTSYGIIKDGRLVGKGRISDLKRKKRSLEDEFFRVATNGPKGKGRAGLP